MTDVTAPQRSPESFLPLHETITFILAALLDGPKHGYAISKFVEERSEGTVRVAIGNLYVSLKRLLDQGLIEPDLDAQEDERRKTKTYKLTGLGVRVLKAEEIRMRRLQSAVVGPGAAWQGAPR